MKKILSLLLLLLTLSVQTTMAQEAKKLQVYRNGEVTLEVALADVDSLIFKAVEDAAVKTHVLTLEKTVGGTITASWSATGNHPAGSKTSSDTTAVTADVPHGAKVSIANTPAEGYTFTSVSANDFTMTGDTTITATFTKQISKVKVYYGTNDYANGYWKSTSETNINRINEALTWDNYVEYDEAAGTQTFTINGTTINKAHWIAVPAEVEFIKGAYDGGIPQDITLDMYVDNTTATWQDKVIDGVTYHIYAYGPSSVLGVPVTITVKIK